MYSKVTSAFAWAILRAVPPQHQISKRESLLSMCILAVYFEIDVDIDIDDDENFVSIIIYVSDSTFLFSMFLPYGEECL